MKYKEFIDKIKGIDKEIKYLNIMPMHDFMVEQRLTKKGRYKITLEFDAKEILKNPDSIPFKEGDMRFAIRMMFLKFRIKKKKAGK